MFSCRVSRSVVLGLRTDERQNVDVDRRMTMEMEMTKRRKEVEELNKGMLTNDISKRQTLNNNDDDADDERLTE